MQARTYKEMAQACEMKKPSGLLITYISNQKAALSSMKDDLKNAEAHSNFLRAHIAVIEKDIATHQHALDILNKENS